MCNNGNFNVFQIDSKLEIKEAPLPTFSLLFSEEAQYWIAQGMVAFYFIKIRSCCCVVCALVRSFCVGVRVIIKAYACVQRDIWCLGLIFYCLLPLKQLWSTVCRSEDVSKEALKANFCCYACRINHLPYCKLDFCRLFYSLQLSLDNTRSSFFLKWQRPTLQLFLLNFLFKKKTSKYFCGNLFKILVLTFSEAKTMLTL